RLFRSAPRLLEARGESWFAVLTQEPHSDVNQCILAPGATPADAERVVSLLDDADVPAVVSVSSQADDAVTAPLARAELKPLPLPEPLMWCEAPPAVESAVFAVERVRGDED